MISIYKAGKWVVYIHYTSEKDSILYETDKINHEYNK